MTSTSSVLSLPLGFWLQSYVTAADESQVVIPESGYDSCLLGNWYPLCRRYQSLTHMLERNGSNMHFFLVRCVAFHYKRCFTNHGLWWWSDSRFEKFKSCHNWNESKNQMLKTGNKDRRKMLMPTAWEVHKGDILSFKKKKQHKKLSERSCDWCWYQ